MTDYELPQEAQDLLSEVTRVEERAEYVRDDIRQQIAEATSQFNHQRVELERDRQVFEALVEERSRGYGLIAEAWRDYELARADLTAEFLEEKKRAGPTAAELVRAKGRELAELKRRLKLAEYIVQLYEWHFPWLVEFRDVSEAEAYAEQAPEEEVGGKEDPAKGWLSAEEWEALSEVERNQRALDRYLNSRKTNWQLGRDYERYIGYLREQDGCAVTYHGIFRGLEDLGRDVLAEKNGVIEVIQCKRWAKAKTIHEKHIFQLYGTMVLAKIEDPKKEITGTFTTTTKLSETAREVAEFLDIKVQEGIPLDDYPRISATSPAEVRPKRSTTSRSTSSTTRRWSTPAGGSGTSQQPPKRRSLGSGVRGGGEAVEMREDPLLARLGGLGSPLEHRTGRDATQLQPNSAGQAGFGDPQRHHRSRESLD